MIPLARWSPKWNFTLYLIIYANFHALSTVCVSSPTCIYIRDKTITKQTHTIINILIQLAVKMKNKIKPFILHSFKFAAVYMLPLTASTRKLSWAVINFSTVSDSLFSQQHSGIASIHSGASKNGLGVEDRFRWSSYSRWLWVQHCTMTCGVDPMLFLCWPTVLYAGPTLNHTGSMSRICWVIPLIDQNRPCERYDLVNVAYYMINHTRNYCL